MSRPRFLADHNFRSPIVNGVIRAEPACEIVTALELGVAAATDDDVLSAAADQGLIALTHDRNTMAGIAQDRVNKGLPMKGLFVARSERTYRRQLIDFIVLIWASTEAEEWDGRIEFLP